jgi:hypothetical protein
MPAREIMKKFRAHQLHSGKGGKIVRSKRQAKAILLSYLRKEGRIGPRPNTKKKSRSRKRITTKRS